jgi:hypothetical protein
MITLNKWYPLVHPTPYDAKSIAFEKACKRVEEEYKVALECHKQVKATEEMEVELYNRRGRQNTIELGSFDDTRRFRIFV